jgi:hypothetical protein
MIINHKYKFIFLKTRKTGSTSIEIALSESCGPRDIITPLVRDDEMARRALGFRPAQNYRIPLRYYHPEDWLRLLLGRKRKQFYNHASAVFIRDNIPGTMWESYYKFCFERNPFDKAVSRYYWSTQEPRPLIADYLEAAPIRFLSNWDIYSINDQVAVDFVGRFEALDEDLAVIKDRLHLPANFTLPRAKSASRTNRKHYSAILDSRARARIALVCAKEMVAFNYAWNERADS